jgi:hypothetical protein
MSIRAHPDPSRSAAAQGRRAGRGDRRGGAQARRRHARDDVRRARHRPRRDPARRDEAALRDGLRRQGLRRSRWCCEPEILWLSETTATGSRGGLPVDPRGLRGGDPPAASGCAGPTSSGGVHAADLHGHAGLRGAGARGAASRRPRDRLRLQPAAAPGGPRQKPRPSPVAARPGRSASPSARPASLRDPAEQAAFAALGAEVAVVVAYGLILPRAVLDAPRGAVSTSTPRSCRAGGGRADPARDHGRRCRDRGLHHGDGGRARHRAGAAARGGADRAGRDTAGDLHDRLGRARRAADRRGAGAARHAGAGAAARGRRHLRRQDRQGRGAGRLDPAGGRGRPADPRPRALSRRLVRDRGARVKLLPRLA